MKKKNTVAVILILAICSVLLISCTDNKGGGGKNNNIADLNDGVTRICLLINGNLGDLSFFDSANAGMLQFQKDHPDTEVKVVVMGTDSSTWEPTLRQTANEAYDLIIVGTSQMAEPLQRLIRTGRYTDRRFIIFDSEIEDNKSADYPTVHSIMFKQNEGGYLAGALTALMSNEANNDKTAFIGGMKIDIINDFGAGFMHGIKKANEDFGLNIKAYNAYVGDFYNSPKGKSLADTFYEDTNILFAAASQAGQGAIDSAKNKNKMIVGVDSDQYDYFKKTDAVKADKIVTSILKRVDLALYEACEAFLEGTLTYGDLVTLGIKEGKIDYVNNENYQAKVPEEIRNYIAELYQAIINGDIVVGSGLKRYTTITELNALYDSLDPNK